MKLASFLRKLLLFDPCDINKLGTHQTYFSQQNCQSKYGAIVTLIYSIDQRNHRPDNYDAVERFSLYGFALFRYHRISHPPGELIKAIDADQQHNAGIWPPRLVDHGPAARRFNQQSITVYVE